MVAVVPKFKLKMTLLEKNHYRDRFDCGEVILNDYLKKFSKQNDEKNLSKTFILSSMEEPQKIIGFYTLSVGNILFENLPEKMKKLPKYPIPIIRIGRLAVDKIFQGKGMGEYLLMDSLYRAVLCSEEIGVFGVVVDAKHDKAKNFYQKYGFETLQNAPLTLIPRIQNIAASAAYEENMIPHCK